MWDGEPSVKAKSLKNEKRISKALGIIPTKGSGNTVWPSAKGDGAHSQIMFEYKETDKATLSVDKTVLGKLCREAAVVGKESALVMSAYGLPDPIPKDWVAVPLPFFEELLEAWYDG
jgi:hypothetical protein